MMTRIYLKLFVCFIVISSAAVMAASSIGHFRTPNPVLDGIYEGCTSQEQPCWYGIRPGITPIDTALQIVNATHYESIRNSQYVVTLVYQNDHMRCAVELRAKAQIVDTVTIINCLDRQVGDLIGAMHNPTHKLPFSMGMLDAIMSEEVMDSYENYLPCLSYTPYGQIIGMPLGVSGEAIATEPRDWHDFLPYGWYVHDGGSLSCDVVDSHVKSY